MTKSELINAIAEQGNLSKADAGRSLLAAVKKRGKLADFDDGNRPSILVNKKRGSLRPPFCCNKRMSEWLLVLHARRLSVASKSSNGPIPRSSCISSIIGNW